MAPLDAEAPLDMVVANLPYITPQQFEELEAEVRDYEPRLALVATGDGLDVYRRLVPQAWARLRPGGCLLIEIDPRQREAALEMMQGFTGVELVPDLAGRDRLLVGREG